MPCVESETIDLEDRVKIKFFFINDCPLKDDHQKTMGTTPFKVWFESPCFLGCSEIKTTKVTSAS